MSFKITVDTGGTFTDVVVVDHAAGKSAVGKAPSTAEAVHGVRAAIDVAAENLGMETSTLLADTDVIVYATTRATNAVLEDKTARTAMLVTEGFPDILVLREGGKLNGFDLTVPFPEPYVPKRLTFEIPERVNSEGEITRPLDEDAARSVIENLIERRVEAVAVALLWSNVNGVHERRIGELLEEVMPGVPYTLSHRLNPIVREYRRASSSAIDASLKPLMGSHFRGVEEGLSEIGFSGELLVATSFGGVMHVDELSERPVYSLRSGPSMGPVAGQTYGKAELAADEVIVCDAGGTSFEVSLIRDGNITYTRETWLGPQFTGHLIGSSAVDVRSIGAGGGSIAWIDPGGLLRVGPQSAGAEPGPACYGRGGTKPTVTDAAVVLGYLDPEMFLGGRLDLDPDASRQVMTELANDLGQANIEEVALGVLSLANERMVRAIQDMTINEGVDPRDSVIVAGGGAAGLGIAEIVRELGCGQVLVPGAAGALSAVGAQFCDVVAEFTRTHHTDTHSFDLEGTNRVLTDLRGEVEEFADGLRRRGFEGIGTQWSADARYAYQVWELEVPLPNEQFQGEDDIEALSDAFDALHQRVFSVAEPGAKVECLTWKARLLAPMGELTIEELGDPNQQNGSQSSKPGIRTRRSTYFVGGWQETNHYLGATLAPGTEIEGPAVIEEPTSTLVVPSAAAVTVTSAGNYLMEV